MSLILPYELSQKTSIFPKYFFKSLFLPFIIPSFATKVNKKFLKKFKIKGSEEFKSTFLKHEFLSDIISTHNLYISTRIENGFLVLSLRPNESIISKEDLKTLYDIMDELGKLLVNKRQNLENTN